LSLPRVVLMCHADDGSVPVLDWLFKRLDTRSRTRIEARIDRVEDGNFGDVKPIGDGLSELRMDFGPGYQLYFGQVGDEVHLIRGGSKATQAADIAAAREFWRGHGVQDHTVS
jgi:putative addiction module killer protein